MQSSLQVNTSAIEGGANGRAKSRYYEENTYVVGVETYFITYFTAVQKLTLLQRTIHDLLWNTRDGRRIKFNFTEFFCAVGVAIL